MYLYSVYILYRVYIGQGHLLPRVNIGLRVYRVYVGHGHALPKAWTFIVQGLYRV